MTSSISNFPFEEKKAAANAAFKAGDYTAAIAGYTHALDTLESSRLDMKNDVFASARAVLLTNRANALGKRGGSDGDDDALARVIGDCTEALEVKPGHTKALYHRALAYESRGDLASMELALRDWASVLQQDRSNKVAGAALNRVRVAVARLQEAESAPAAVVQRLRDRTAANEVHGALRRVMGVVMNQSPQVMAAYVDADLPDALMKWCLSVETDAAGALVSVHAKRALGVLLSTNVRVKDTSLFSDEVVATFVRTLHNTRDAVELQATVHILSRVATHASLSPMHMHTVVAAFMRGLIVDTAAVGDGDVQRYYDDVLDELERKCLHLLLSGLSVVASSVPARRDELREQLAIPLLFSPLATVQALRLSILSAVVAVIADMNTSDGGGGDDSKKGADGKEPMLPWKENMAKYVNLRLLVDSTFMVAANALSLVLQANQALGQFIVTHGGTKDQMAAPLQQLLFKTDDGDSAACGLAAEVIALASQDPMVRAIVVAGGHTDVFIDMLASADFTVRCHAALSLAKLVATSDGKDLRPQVLDDNRLVKAIGEVLAAYEAQVLRRREAEVAARQQEQQQQQQSLLSRTSALEGKDVSTDQLRMVVEVLAYVSLHSRAKMYIATDDKGATFRRLTALGTSTDRAMRFGVVKVLQNLCTSADDIRESLNKEIEQLREFASKGLGQTESNTKIAELAGTGKEIKIVKNLCCQRGLVQYLDRIYHIASQEDTTTTTTTTTTKKKKDAAPGSITEELAENMVAVVLLVASEPENRGLLVQQKGLRLLLNLHQIEKSKYSASLALARVCVSTNPNLFPDGMARSIVHVLLDLLKSWQHELHQFEALLGLTNLASMGNDIREHVMSEGGWREISYAMASTNDTVQRACVQALSNLVVCDSALERLRGSAGDQDIKIFLACARGDDVEMVLAATGALAMASHVKEIAEKIVASDGMLTLLALTQNPDDGVRKRVTVALDNVARHNPDLTKDIGDTMEKLRAVAAADNRAL